MKHKIQRFLTILEPYTLLAAYISICASAFFSWVHPLDIQNYFGFNDALIQSLLFSVGGILCIIGHISKIIIIELLGLIPSIFGSYVFLYIAISYVMATNDLNLGQIIGFIAIAMFTLTHRAFKVQHEISAKWLKPKVDQFYDK